MPLILAATSHVPYYIVGGVLVLWAVVLAGIGLQRPDFPFNARGQRGVMAISFVLAVLTIAAAIATA